VFRLITALPRLQLIVGALIKSVPSMGYISLLMLIQVYIFAVLGNYLFGKYDPENFGNLGASMLTLFQVITLEGWVEVMKALPENIVTSLYFVSFILLGTMIILNLFIGVILSGFEEVKKEIETDMNKLHKKNSVKDELTQISEQMDILRLKLDAIIATKREN
jgi:voltage-gated sodium channel